MTFNSYIGMLFLELEKNLTKTKNQFVKDALLLDCVYKHAFKNTCKRVTSNFSVVYLPDVNLIYFCKRLISERITHNLP